VFSGGLGRAESRVEKTRATLIETLARHETSKTVTISDFPAVGGKDIPATGSIRWPPLASWQRLQFCQRWFSSHFSSHLRKS
jgi:hypothetical protein